MKKNQIVIGATYMAKVSDKIVPVTITRENPLGGWTGINNVTKRGVLIKTAGRLRRLVKPTLAALKADAETPAPSGDRPAVTVFRVCKGGAYHWRSGDSECPKNYIARDQAVRSALKAHPNAVISYEPDPTTHHVAIAHSVPKIGEPAESAPLVIVSAKTEPDAGAATAKPAKRVSLLDAAATVLTSAKAPMTAKAIVEQVTAKGLWTSGKGKTPHATLYAAMIREIAKKENDARFKKVKRGLFTAA